MELREPRKKSKVRFQLGPLFPITIDQNCSDKWTVYTAHLTDLGSCIVNPDDIKAVHSMGFFGKGSLSRSFPSFSKARYGAPPLIKNRQWVKRQEWLKQVKELGEETLSNPDNNINWEGYNTEKNTFKENIQKNDKITCIDNVEDRTLELDEENKEQGNLENAEIVEIIEKAEETNECGNSQSNVDEIILDSAEEDDVYEIINRDIDRCDSRGSNNSNETQISKNDEDKYLIDNYDIKDKFNNENRDIQGKLLILPDSDSETEGYLQNIKPRIECESFPIREALHLTFEETFFLLYGLGCLQIINFDGTLLDIDSAWIYFCTKDKNFLQRYVVYHYYRSKGWIVKSGLKYGGDFLLYKQGPPFYHASYIVIVDVVHADNLMRIPEKCKHNITWNTLFGLDRLAQATAKEILFAQVLWPSSVSQDTYPQTSEILSEFTIKEVLWRRWNPKQNRDVKEDEDCDDDTD